MGPTNKELSIIMKMRDEVTKKINTIQGHLIKFGNTVKKHFLAVAAAVAGLVVVMKQLVDAAVREEDAIKRLNNALELQGFFTEKVSRQYQNFAKEMQRSTRFGNEAVMELMQQLISVGNVAPDQMERAAQAAIDFAAATGRDLKTAALTVGKAMTGFTGELSRYGIIIDKNIPATEKATAALEAMERQFGGMARGDVETFSGKMEQLKNHWGDLLEEMGKFITQSPKTGKAIENITQLLGGWAEKLNLVNERMKEGTEANLIARIQKITEFIEQQQNLLGRNLFGDREGQAERINKALEFRAELFTQLNELRVKENETMSTGNALMAETEGRVGKIIDLENERTKAVEKFSEFSLRMAEEDAARFEADLEGKKALLQEWHNIQRTANATTFQLAADAMKNFHSGMSDALSGIILGTKKASEAFKELGQSMLKTIVDWIVQKGIAMAMEIALGGAIAAFTTGMAVQLAAAWAPAAALASLATLGGNAVPAAAALVSTAATAQLIAATAAVPRARGGDDIVRKPTLFLAGEAGPERALFQPLGGPFKGGGVSDGVVINIGPVYQQPGESTDELARRLGDYAFRQRRYYGLT